MTKTRNKLKIIGLVLALVMMVSLLGLFSLTASAVAGLVVTIDTGESFTLKDADGDGYYDIGTADALYAFAAAVNGGNTAINGELTANIVVNKNVLTADGKLNGDGSNFRAWTPIGDGSNRYTGIFNGNGYTISGLYFNNNEVSYVGLFGRVTRSGKVTNVGIINNYINGNDYIGGVVGYNDYGTVENCYNTGSVCCNNDYSAKVGGVVGYNYYGTLNNCYNTGNVSGTDYGVGGVVGYNFYGTVGNCYNTGTVSSTYSGVGGVAGVTDYNCIVLNSYNTGNISGTKYIGGVVGRLLNGSTVQNCYNTGNVSGTDVCVGGVVGEIYKENTVTNCYYLSGCAKDGNGVTQFGVGNETKGSTTADVADQTNSRTNEQFNSGDICTAVGYHAGSGTANGFCDVCDYAPATLNADGYYEIGNAGQLFWFAQQVNIAGNTTANAKLTADIDLENRTWYPIGVYNDVVDASGTTAQMMFKGTLDGCDYTVSNFTAIGTGSQGLVGYSDTTVVVKNLGVINATVSGWNAGAVLAYQGTVENCYAINCKVTGYTTASDAESVYAGAVAGSQSPTVKNSFAYNCQVISGTGMTATLAPVGGELVSNSYYVNVTATNGTLRSHSGEKAMTTAQFASGEVAYLLGEAWGQNIGINKYPVPDGKTVYENTICEKTAYSNTDKDIPHNFDEKKGLCPNCDVYEPATLVTNENYASLGLNAEYVDYYAISNAGQLFWFAQQVNVEGNREIKGVLTADIDLENRPWTPIGSTGEENNNFRGVFDGQNHTIKGLYVEGGRAGLGFFGEVRTGTVKNFTIYGEVVVNTEVDYVGGVIGSICGVNGETDLERNGAIIQNITSYVNLTAKAHGVGMIGGFVGYANHQSLIENCSWYGTFDAGIYRVDSGAGGFIGKIQENTSEVTIRNCAAYGTIKTNYAGDYNNTATIYMGGFLSFSNTGAKTTLENCLFAGKFERGENLTDQAFLGAFGTLRSVNAIKNCYYLGDDGLEAVHSDSNLKPGSDNVEITSVTKAQLLSGEVAYKLGEHFGQILEGENRQSYPVLGGEAVPSSRFEIYGQQLNIGGDLSMKYYVMGYAPEFNSKGLYMEFSHNGVKTKVYAGEPNADGFYVFVLEGINPQCMGDSIRAMLYYNETEVTSHGCEDGKEYSVEKNLLNLLEKYKDDAALVALINDTLAYGKAASEYKKHDTMTGDYTVSDSTIPDATVTPNGAFTGYTVVFGQVNFIKVSVELADGYTLYLDETDITSQLVGGIFKTDGIAPTEFDQKFTFEIKNGDTSVQTFAVSVNDYIGAQKDSATMGNLVKALYNYGYSAKVYPHLSQKDDNHLFVYTANEDGTHTGTCVCGEEVIGAHTMSSKTGDCTICNTLVAAASITVDTVKTYYYTFEEAVAYANGKEGTVIVVENDCTVNDTVDFESGSVTIDLNGKAIDSTSNYIFYNADGSITIRDSVGGGRTVQSVDGSTVIIEGGTHAELVGGNNLIVTGGNFARVAVTTGETATISGGSFEDIGIHSSVGTLADMLADGYCFYDKDGNVVDVSTIQTDEYGWYNLYNVTVGAIKEN